MSGPDHSLHVGTEAGRAEDAGSGWRLRGLDVAMGKVRAALRPWGPFKAVSCSSE